MKNKKEWFEDWFDTTFYHILYQDRDYQEAEKFISKLSGFLNLPQGAYILDLACGKGRHAVQLNELGYNVKGVDLSENSINAANKYSNDNLAFTIGDMRKPLEEEFDAVYNLFTSFGYFNSCGENLKVLQAIHKMLKSNGVFVIDFMNSKKVIAEMRENEQIEKGGINFLIEKKLYNNQIIKTISFNHEEKDYQYQEQVQALCLSDFNELMAQTNLVIDHIFGNYLLEAYDEESSDRLIIIGRKS